MVGILGLSLPVVLVLGMNIGRDCDHMIEGSISDYFHTKMGNFFVGIMCFISVFLFSYKGYDKDWIAGKLACLFGLITVFVPTSLSIKIDGMAVPKEICFPCDHFAPCVYPGIMGYVHLISAALFLLTLAYFSIFLFTKTGKDGKMTAYKRKRNLVYRICGYIIIICIVLLVPYFVSSSIKKILLPYHIVFWMETIAVFAFGFSWLVKGETLWKDR